MCLVCLCVSCVCIACEGWKGGSCSLGLKLQLVSPGVDPVPTGKAASTLNCCAIPLAQDLNFNIIIIHFWATQGNLIWIEYYINMKGLFSLY